MRFRSIGGMISRLFVCSSASNPRRVEALSKERKKGERKKEGNGKRERRGGGGLKHCMYVLWKGSKAKGNLCLLVGVFLFGHLVERYLMEGWIGLDWIACLHGLELV